MALSTDELNAIRALWEEWAPDGFRVTIDVREDRAHAAITTEQRLGARIGATLYCQVQVWHGARDLVFSERVPHDAAMLRASVTTLARYLASQAGEDG